MKKHVFAALLLITVSACAGSGVISTTVAPDPTPIPTDTAIHETDTPTPSPVPDPTVTEPPPPFPTLEVDFEDLSIQEAGLRTEFQSDVANFEMATRYWIEEFEPENEFASIQGMARIRLNNQYQERIDEIVLMLWPNQSQYQAEMKVGSLIVNNEFLDYEVDPSNLFLTAPLNEDLEPGGVLDMSIPFEVIASGTIGEIGLKRFGISYSILAAPTFYPLVPRRVDGEWQRDLGSRAGDTTNSDIAFYSVTLTTPDEFILVASGVEVAVDQGPDGSQTKTFVTGPMRDFAFVLGPFDQIKRGFDGVKLNGWVLRGHIGDGERMMAAAVDQFELLSNLVGPYPYPELDLVDVPGGFGGIEYPGLVFIGTLGEFDIVDPTVHEVAHQWFYGLIGNDQLIEPWLDEGVSRFAQVLYYENYVSETRARGMVNLDRSLLLGHDSRTLPIGLSIIDYNSPADYVLFVYSKGSLFFDQLRASLGEGDFEEFLKQYYSAYRYGFATSQGFKELAENVCQCDLEELFDLWVFEGGEISFNNE
jgi:hypothetical protein